MKNVSPATKTTLKTNVKRKAAAPAPKTTAKCKRKGSAGNTIQEPAADEEQTAAAKAINELLELSEDDDDPSEGNVILVEAAFLILHSHFVKK